MSFQWNICVYLFVKFTFNKDHPVASASISVLTRYHQRGPALSNKDQRSSDLSKPLVQMISQHHWEQYVVAAQLLGHIWLFATPWLHVAHLASMSFTISRSLLKLKSKELVMPSNHLILCHLLLLLPSMFPSIRVFFHQVAKVSELQLQHQSFQWIFRVDFL